MDKRYIYSEFCKIVFDYFQNKINTMFPIILNIDTENEPESYGVFTAPNTITIYLNKIINEYWPDDNNIKTSIIECVIRELLHSIQIIDHNRYHSNDYEYFLEIEQTAYKESSEFILTFREDIEKLFNVNFSHRIDSMERDLLINKDFIDIRKSKREYVLNLFRLLFNNQYKSIINCMSKYRNLHITINDKVVRINPDSNNSRALNKLITVLREEALMYKAYNIKILDYQIYSDINTYRIVLEITPMV